MASVTHGTMVDSNKTGGSPAGTSKQTLSAEEMDDQLEQFTSLMQQKFLSGEDFGQFTTLGSIMTRCWTTIGQKKPTTMLGRSISKRISSN
uniref:CCD97-like C-terminal domain-containing protein n=1 Tax=Oryza glumipatula TaxID=40148 RepID=A0A0E0BJJ4_9ORYZ